MRSGEIEHLVSLLLQAEKFHLAQAERSRRDDSSGHDERAATRSLLFHATAATEALVDLVIGGEPLVTTSGQTLGPKLRRLRALADAHSPHPIDSITLMHLSDLLLRLRNRAAHWSDPATDVRALMLQGDLGLRLSKSFVWLITVSLESFLDDGDELVRVNSHDEPLPGNGEWYVGIDGDGTGRYIADSMRDIQDCKDEIRLRSDRISSAIDKLRKRVVEKCGRNSVLFATGDNILFRGQITSALVDDLLFVYLQETTLTASAGIGRTPHQASIALSLAKAEGGAKKKIITLSGNDSHL